MKTITTIVSTLTLAFVALKLAGVISWSWWAVTALLWAIPAYVATILAGSLVVSLFGLVLLGFSFLLEDLRKKY